MGLAQPGRSFRAIHLDDRRVAETCADAGLVADENNNGISRGSSPVKLSARAGSLQRKLFVYIAGAVYADA